MGDFYFLHSLAKVLRSLVNVLQKKKSPVSPLRLRNIVTITIDRKIFYQFRNKANEKAHPELLCNERALCTDMSPKEYPSEAELGDFTAAEDRRSKTRQKSLTNDFMWTTSQYYSNITSMGFSVCSSFYTMTLLN